MSSPQSISLYLSLAERLYQREITQKELISLVQTLPRLDQTTLEALWQESENIALSLPAQGWAICSVAEQAARFQNCDQFTCAQAAWHLAKAAAAWERPDKLAQAVRVARTGFEELNLPGWLAACDWIAETISIAHSGFENSSNNLQKTAGRLKAAGMEKEYFLCLIDLVWKQYNLTQLNETEKNLDLCDAYFTSQNDFINLARSMRIRVHIHIKTGHFEESHQYLEKAKSIFEAAGSQVNLAKCYFSEGLLNLYSTTDFERTQTAFKKSIDFSKACNLKIQEAESFQFLAALYLQVGDFKAAQKYILQAQKTFNRFNIPFLYANSLGVEGSIQEKLGHLETSIALFQQAYQIHQKYGQDLAMSNDLFNLGSAYTEAGRYQQALQALETACDKNRKINFTSRTGLSELYLARLWLLLKNHPNALEHLTNAEIALRPTNQADSQVTIARLRAKIFFDQGDIDQAFHSLTTALSIASKNNIPAQTAFTHRLLGEVLMYKTAYVEAREHLQRALEAFAEMNMPLEQASSLVSLGRIHLATYHLDEAEHCFAAALALSQGDYQEVEWHCMSLQAELELIRNQPEKALLLYQQATQVISQLRSGFWQPSLAGTYAQVPQEMFDHAIALAARLTRPEELLQFIEADKAGTLISQMSLPASKQINKSEQALIDLRNEIDWIQNQMRVNTAGSNMQTLMQMRSLRKDLQTKSRRYETLLSKLERQQGDQPLSTVPQLFSLQEFRRLADHCCGKNWLAVDYHQLADAVMIVILSPDSLIIEQVPIRPRFIQALTACQQGFNSLEKEDLAVLGGVLLPTALTDQLTPETCLLLAPHRQLHSIPWAGIGETPLVERAIPCVVPSLRAFELICGQNTPPTEKRPEKKNGLLIGISEFNGRHPDLPFVVEEVQALRSQLGEEGQLLQNETASRAILDHLSHSDQNGWEGLKKFAWLHVASHFFSDPASGYLSGIALSNETLWLDQIRDLAPLPELITFSGCSGIFSRIYDGDEHISLPSTCLISGAQTVVGSVWPIMDESSARLMTLFYENYLTGYSPAASLTYAQRKILRADGSPAAWVSFACLGKP